MRYLSGVKTPAHTEMMRAGELGLLRTPANGYRLDDVAVWAMDNGAFTNTYPGDEEYLELLRRLSPHAGRALFAAAPDTVGDAEATLATSMPMASRIREAGYAPALVGQDGMENLPVPWEEFEWLFIGGSTEWKLGRGAVLLSTQALSHGLSVHVGRVNSFKRFRYARDVLGASSADGTILAFGPETNLRRVKKWLASNDQQTLGVMYHRE